MTGQRAVTFRNRAGEALAGVLHDPPGGRSDVGIILLSPGIKGRVAPHRLYRKMARHYASMGFRVLRFDFAGLGDSGGRLSEPLLADLYRSIQLGRYVDDCLDAVAWFRSHGNVRRVILGGLCGGAITGLLASPLDGHVAGILSIGMPVTLDGTSVDKVAGMSKGQLHSIRRQYVRKLFDVRSWARLLTLRTDLRLLSRSFRALLPGTVTRAASVPMVQGDNANPRFSPALLESLSAGLPILLVYSGADRLYWEYRERFAEPYAEALTAFDSVLEVRLIDKANHVLTFPEWQREMLALSETWLQRHFPAPVEGPREPALSSHS